MLGGGWKQIALGRKLGVPQALGLTVEEWVRTRLGGYVRLSLEERREAVKELTAPAEQGGMGMSTREAAGVLGVGYVTVASDRQAVQNRTAEGEPASQKRVGAVQNRTTGKRAAPVTRQRDPDADAWDDDVPTRDVDAEDDATDAPAPLANFRQHQLGLIRSRRVDLAKIRQSALVLLVQMHQAEPASERETAPGLV